MKLSETKKNIINIVNDYSQEFGIAPHFVEKDYYVVKVLSEISKIKKAPKEPFYFLKFNYAAAPKTFITKTQSTIKTAKTMVILPRIASRERFLFLLK